MRRGGPKGTFQLMRRLGYAGAGIMSWNVVSGDSAGGNEAVRQALEFFPPGYWGLGSFDPVHFSQEELENLIPQLYADRRFLGMKPYHFGIRYDDPRYDVWWKYGNQRRLYGLIDHTIDDCTEVDNLASRFPDVSWVIAHTGGSYKAADQAIACIEKHPNVFAEITYTTVTAGIIDYLVEHAGEDRVLYGSDLPMRDPRQQLGWVIYSRINEKVKARVLGLNALAIIGRVVSLQSQRQRAARPCIKKRFRVASFLLCRRR